MDDWFSLIINVIIYGVSFRIAWIMVTLRNQVYGTIGYEPDFMKWLYPDFSWGRFKNYIEGEIAKLSDGNEF